MAIVPVPNAADKGRVRSRESLAPAVLFLLVCIWTAVSLAGGSLAGALLPLAAQLVDQAVTAVLLLLGFLLIARFGIADLRPSSSIGLVQRATAWQEFGRGAALGWATTLALLLPALMTGNLHLQFTWTTEAVRLTAVSLVHLLIFALAMQLVVSGLPVRLLTGLVSPVFVLVAAMALALMVTVRSGPAPLTAILLPVLAVGMFVTGFLRTRALWLSLGLQIGWTLSQQVLFGTTTRYTPGKAGVVQNLDGTLPWLTGSTYDSEYWYFALLVLMAAWITILPLTRTYAWYYTYQSPEPGGYPVEVQPPPQHTAQTAQPAAAPLVQIGGTVPPPKS